MKTKIKNLSMFFVLAMMLLPVAAGAQWNIYNLNQFNLPDQSIWNILNNLLYWLLGIFGIIAIIGFAISGIMYLLAAGDQDLAERGKNGMKWSIIGVVVGLSGLVLIQAINYALNAYRDF